MVRTLAIVGAIHIETSAFIFVWGASGRLDGQACVTGMGQMGKAFRQGWIGG